MLRRSTWFALIVLAALIGLTLYLRQSKDRAAQAEPTSTPSIRSLFDPMDGQPNSIRIDGGTQGSFAMIRDGNDWLIKEPVQAKADPAQAEAAATQVAALQILSTVDLSAEDAGLTKPAYTFTIGFSGGDQHLQVGDITPTGTGYYARLDDGAILIVSSAGIQGLLNLLAAPPYAETPTPSPVPATKTPVSTGTAAVPTGTSGTPTP